MKHYRIHSKIMIAICICLLIVTAVNFFTGAVNPAMPRSSHVICFAGFAISIFVTAVIENERIKKTGK